MDIRDVSSEEKATFINEVKDVFNNIRSVLHTLETDMVKDDLMIQASAVWISGNLAQWFGDFMREIKKVEAAAIKQQMMEIENENAPNDT
jgi:hypothetical protein